MIIADFASKKAVDKVKKAGGEVKVLQVKKQKIKKSHVKKQVSEPEQEQESEAKKE